jgi:enoyl-CoA hydratase/carnithine racemase
MVGHPEGQIRTAGGNQLEHERRGGIQSAREPPFHAVDIESGKIAVHCQDTTGGRSSVPEGRIGWHTARMLRIDDHGRVRVLTLDRPEVKNAFNTALYDTTAAALAEADGDPGVAVVVITGSEGAFCAGQDLTEMADLVGGGDGAGHGFAPFMDALTAFTKPLIAAVNGVGVGLGFTIVGHCDLVLVSEEARFKTPFTSLGVAPEAASSYLFPLLAGWQDAAHILFTSRWVSGAEAVDLGLAWRLCSPEDLMTETLAVAGEVAAMPVASLIATKRVMTAARSDAIAAARRREDAEFSTLIGGPANTEALTAFMEKRDPDFTGL